MDNEGEIQIDVLCEQFPQVECFVQHYTYYTSLRDAHPSNEDLDFWDEASTVFLGSAILVWCNVFGSCNSNLHWSKLIKNMPFKVEQDFKDRIYKSTGLGEEGFKELRNDIKALRDKYFAHRDRNWQEHIWNSPDFDNALKVAMVYGGWLNDLLEKESSPLMNSLSDIVKSAEEEIKNVIEHLSS